MQHLLLISGLPGTGMQGKDSGDHTFTDTDDLNQSGFQPSAFCFTSLCLARQKTCTTKPKLIESCLLSFISAAGWQQLHVLSSSSDWFIFLFASVIIVQRREWFLWCYSIEFTICRCSGNKNKTRCEWAMEIMPKWLTNRELIVKVSKDCRPFNDNLNMHAGPIAFHGLSWWVLKSNTAFVCFCFLPVGDWYVFLFPPGWDWYKQCGCVGA